MSDMEVGLALPSIDDPEPFRQQVQTAERLGIHALWTYDSGRGADPFASSGYLAAVTSRVQICCGILNPFLRHPALLASGAAAVDRLSGGALPARRRSGLGTGRRARVWRCPPAPVS
jgi:5,10-methylenetetrahydromethanopterin reductase